MRQIAAAESVTQLEDVADKVLVVGSHGGVIAAYLGAKAGAHALVLNDAGVGKDRAGIAGLGYLDAIGMAAATVDCMSARIGDGADTFANGRIFGLAFHRAGRVSSGHGLPRTGSGSISKTAPSTQTWQTLLKCTSQIRRH